MTELERERNETHNAGEQQMDNWCFVAKKKEKKDSSFVLMTERRSDKVPSSDVPCPPHLNVAKRPSHRCRASFTPDKFQVWLLTTVCFSVEDLSTEGVRCYHVLFGLFFSFLTRLNYDYKKKGKRRQKQTPSLSHGNVSRGRRCTVCSRPNQVFVWYQPFSTGDHECCLPF